MAIDASLGRERTHGGARVFNAKVHRGRGETRGTGSDNECLEAIGSWLATGAPPARRSYLALALRTCALRYGRFVFCAENIAIGTDGSLFGHGTVHLVEFPLPFFITE